MQIYKHNHNSLPKLRIGGEGDEERQCLFPVINVYKHSTLLPNSPPKFEDEIGRREGRALLIDSHTQMHYIS